jgi:putative ATP-binding cassette transporter
MAFSTLVAAFSLIVTQFQSLSNFAAVVARLSSLIEAVERLQSTTGSEIEIVEAEGRLAYEGLTLLSPTDGSPLLKDLSISIPFGTRVLITGSSEVVGVALLRATAGCPATGAGRIIRPGVDEILFLAQRPYLPPGTLRQLLEGNGHASSDDRILELLRTLNLEQALAQAGGLDTERDWEALLSLRDQQLLALAHVLLTVPRFVFLDRVGTALGSDQITKILRMLGESSITYICHGDRDRGSADLYDAVLEWGEDGSWTWTDDANER